MKKSLYIGAIAFLASLSAFALDARVSRVGVHTGMSAGGEVEESDICYGAQAELALQPQFGLELSVSAYSDEVGDPGISLEHDVVSIGFSAVGRFEVNPNIQAFMLGGVDYNIIDAEGRVDPMVFLGADIPLDVDIDVDNAIGFHLGAGLAFTIQEHLELFLEYRYTAVEADVEIAVGSMGFEERSSVESDFDFGLLKVGVNYLF